MKGAALLFILSFSPDAPKTKSNEIELQYLNWHILRDLRLGRVLFETRFRNNYQGPLYGVILLTAVFVDDGNDLANFQRRERPDYEMPNPLHHGVGSLRYSVHFVT